MSSENAEGKRIRNEELYYKDNNTLRLRTTTPVPFSAFSAPLREIIRDILYVHAFVVGKQQYNLEIFMVLCYF